MNRLLWETQKTEDISGDPKSKKMPPLPREEIRHKTQVGKNAEFHLTSSGGQDVFVDGAVSVEVSEYRIRWTWKVSPMDFVELGLDGTRFIGRML